MCTAHVRHIIGVHHIQYILFFKRSDKLSKHYAYASHEDKLDQNESQFDNTTCGFRILHVYQVVDCINIYIK